MRMSSDVCMHDQEMSTTCQQLPVLYWGSSSCDESSMDQTVCTPLSAWGTDPPGLPSQGGGHPARIKSSVRATSICTSCKIPDKVFEGWTSTKRQPAGLFVLRRTNNLSAQICVGDSADGLWRGGSYLQAVNKSLPLIKDAAHACQQVVPRCQHSLLLRPRQPHSALHLVCLGECQDKVHPLLPPASQDQGLRRSALSKLQVSGGYSSLLIVSQLRSTLHGAMISNQEIMEPAHRPASTASSTCLTHTHGPLKQAGRTARSSP